MGSASSPPPPSQHIPMAVPAGGFEPPPPNRPHARAAVFRNNTPNPLQLPVVDPPHILRMQDIVFGRVFFRLRAQNLTGLICGAIMLFVSRQSDGIPGAYVGMAAGCFLFLCCAFISSTYVHCGSLHCSCITVSPRSIACCGISAALSSLCCIACACVYLQFVVSPSARQGAQIPQGSSITALLFWLASAAVSALISRAIRNYHLSVWGRAMLQSIVHGTSGPRAVFPPQEYVFGGAGAPLAVLISSPPPASHSLVPVHALARETGTGGSGASEVVSDNGLGRAPQAAETREHVFLRKQAAAAEHDDRRRSNGHPERVADDELAAALALSLQLEEESVRAEGGAEAGQSMPVSSDDDDYGEESSSQAIPQQQQRRRSDDV